MNLLITTQGGTVIPAILFYFLSLANSGIYTTDLRDTSENWVMGRDRKSGV